MSNLVENSIPASAFEEPTRYHHDTAARNSATAQTALQVGADASRRAIWVAAQGS